MSGCLLHLFVTVVLVQNSIASLCVVSKWRPWRPCIGTCGYALKVRNRDVLQPPLPEKDMETGEKVIHNCPALYETQQCVLTECQEDSPFTRKDDSFVIGFKQVVKTLDSEPFSSSRPNCNENNDSCCRVVRHNCPKSRTKPQKVIRWYRLPNESFCRPYKYPYCGPNVESSENPLTSESECIQTCLPPRDRVSLPEFRPIK